METQLEFIKPIYFYLLQRIEDLNNDPRPEAETEIEEVYQVFFPVEEKFTKLLDEKNRLDRLEMFNELKAIPDDLLIGSPAERIKKKLTAEFQLEA